MLLHINNVNNLVYSFTAVQMLMYSASHLSCIGYRLVSHELWKCFSSSLGRIKK